MGLVRRTATGSARHGSTGLTVDLVAQPLVGHLVGGDDDDPRPLCFVLFVVCLVFSLPVRMLNVWGDTMNTMLQAQPLVYRRLQCVVCRILSPLRAAFASLHGGLTACVSLLGVVKYAHVVRLAEIVESRVWGRKGG